MESNGNSKPTEKVPEKETTSKSEGADSDTLCGLGFFKPQWLQSWATPRCYLVVFSIVGIIQGSFYTYMIGTLSTLEKRYGFSTKISGTILMMDEMLPLLGGIVCYFGGKMHRPRLMSAGLLLTVGCCFLAVLPYFLYGTARTSDISANNKTIISYCDASEEMCKEELTSPTYVAIACFITASFFKGFSNLIYVMGYTYMDDMVKKKNTAVYLAITYCLRMLGPILGYVMSSAFLKLYENPLIDPGIDPKDPRWVGAWWIGYALIGVCLFFLSFPLMMFPRVLPGQKKAPHQTVAEPKKESLKETILGLKDAMKRLAKNKLYFWLILATTTSCTGGFGYYINLVKYTENQFHLSASGANLISGPPAIAAYQISTLVGGLLIWKYKPTAKKLIFGVAITQFINAFFYLFLMIPVCKDYVMTGTTMNDGLLQLENQCNADCHCSKSVMTPVCGPDGISSYFSPCHAGCKSVTENNEVKSYHNCSCVHNVDGEFEFTANVTNGFCPEEGCDLQKWIYTGLLFTESTMTGVVTVAYPMLFLRSMEVGDKSVGLGMLEAIVAAFGTLPIPVVFGSMVDSACIVWGESCGERSNCWLYDTTKLKYLLHLVSGAFATLSVICYIFVYRHSGSMKNLYEDEYQFKDSKTSSFRKLSTKM